MECSCRKYWRVGLPCPTMQPPPALMEPAGTAAAHPPAERASPRSIAFDVEPAPAHPGVLVPGYNALALPLKPLRDPALSLIALSGVDPSEPVMVEVPLVQNNSAFTCARTLAGRRVGFADRYQRGDEHCPIEHRASFSRALDVLRGAGAQLLPVPAQLPDDGLYFNLHTRNEIDERVTEYRLDALVSDSQSDAFHAACWSGYPVASEPLGDGATLWFYGARWARDSLADLVQGYRSTLGLMGSRHDL
ncbi:hypothetical protein BFW86_21910 [Pseudomonas fluorescens]|nr:hypothetical protein BFW86_21910 [Pseudomonas fluorescens]